jgi:hypothetical protein
MVDPMSGVEFVHMTHPGIPDSSQDVPDEPGAVAWQEARGWVRTDPPGPAPVPRSGDMPAGDTEWVTLWHPLVQATHEFPNNPAALQGAAEAGWGPLPTPGEPDAADTDDAPEPPTDTPPDTAPADGTTPAVRPTKEG